MNEFPEDPILAAEALLSAADPSTVAPGLGPMRTALANAMVGLMKRYYGRGPTAAKAWVLDEYVLVVMEDGLTRAEETLLADGKEDVVRQYRLQFQQTVRDTTMAAIAAIAGRDVLTYHSQIVFGPMRAFEIFVLSSEPAKD